MNTYQLRFYQDFVVIVYQDTVIRKYKIYKENNNDYISTNILDLLYNILIEKKVTIKFINMKGKWKKK